MQTLSAISAEKNSTIIFPLPIDLLSHILPQGHKKIMDKQDSTADDEQQEEDDE